MGASLVLLVSGCSSAGEAGDHHGSQGHDSTSQEAGAHNDADTSFARDMIPHHEQAIVMSDIILAKQGIDPRVVELANQIKSAQGPEIDTMRGWLVEWGSPSMAPGHEGHDMVGDASSHEEMGMMSEQDLEQLRQAQGPDASRLFLTGMIEHHDGAVKMAQTEIDTGRSDPAIHLAHKMIEDQQREIEAMKQILESL
ncbi:DUF305 domain-containing protein [Mycolicibacterium cyprinidarum]|uniref:DUF305 domain-containing protein n=1 Tax=Mycolicibacterium cyprinidarum TaxID=2860311 RepID=A0ABQ4VE70_9MYCO|nr:DUF305 domain-containing protein [Mycolicibacterium sp. NGTWSNA01]GJF12663.1 DUF305 domain-containing protein [Mycolicibacterium sp. NGTWS0302]